MDQETPKNQSKKEEIEEIEEWEIVEETNSKEKSTPETASTQKGQQKPSAIPPRTPPTTTIIKPKKDRNECPKCGSDDIYYFEDQDFYWCKNCKEVYQFEQED